MALNKIQNKPKLYPVVRVSTQKQGLTGDSPERQLQEIKYYSQNNNIELLDTLEYWESGTNEEVQPLQKAINKAINSSEENHGIIICSIDRFTRAGSYIYTNLKEQLKKAGKILVDTRGVIKNEEINTMAVYGFEYKWSKYDPNRKNEILAAENAKDDVRDILTKLIDSEIRYVNMGYAIGAPSPGYINNRIETEYGYRYVLEHHPIEGKWYKTMFELRAARSHL